MQELWQRLQPKLEGNASAKGAVSDLESDPDDPDLQAVFRVQLRKILSEDAAFASEMAQFLEKILHDQPATHALNTGSARDLAEGSRQVQAKLDSKEPGRLPILLPLRQIGRFLQSRPDEGTDGHIHLLKFLLAALKSERIELPMDFFDHWLNSGEAVILLDGLDEVADPELRRRVSRLVEGFTQAYDQCRYVVTSRIVGYTGAARLGDILS